MAIALGEQDRLWQFIELAFHNQGLENTGYVTDTYLRALASAIPGVDVARALAARGSAATLAALDEARALARAAHVAATPSFELLRAAGPPQRFSPAGLDASSFSQALERALAPA